MAPDRVEQVPRWIRELPDGVVAVLAGQLRILVTPMGASKTEQAARWLDEGVQQARDDDAVSVPVWFEAREAKNGVEETVRFRLGQDSRAVCRVVLNDLDRIDPVDAERLCVRPARWSACGRRPPSSQPPSRARRDGLHRLSGRRSVDCGARRTADEDRIRQ